jgi:hypothetical protein
MGYSDDDTMIRVDFFKPSGKWYTTEAIKWDGPCLGREQENQKINLLYDVFMEVLKKHLQQDQEENKIRLAGMTAVCLKPYFEHELPLLMKIPGCYYCGKLICNRECF